MTPENFVTQLGALKFESAFNPYGDQCPTYDLADAPKLRAKMLINLIEAAEAVEVDAIWVGRDLGHRGGRRTGLALTDDVHFHEHLARWDIQMARPTTGRAVPEKTAGVIWQMLDRIDQPVFLWNVYPLHPHVPGKPFSNRSHNAKERNAGIEVLSELVALLRPKRLVAVGNDAEKALERLSLDVPAIKVRHPSYGGQPEFLSLIKQMYDLADGPLL